ncbi:hypothetical protein RB195_012447 [Necator americanus]|uniref:Cystatin domain protein n=1 Tax=Necator americanus TaxID=51031 RepID=A0ABR1D760_NECAM
MRFLVVLAVCAWIAYAKSGCSWDRKYFVGGLVKEAPKPIVETVEKALKKKLPENSALVLMRVKEVDGKEYTYVMIGEVSSKNSEAWVFENKGSTLVNGKASDYKTMRSKASTCKRVGDKGKPNKFTKIFLGE